ncbi:hypothetical protein [Stakelama tenebrarum]|uniref:Uncharacterized protein n=1 Tax=Stakelama tenebrarum TaxID=2711215 RepID=A0A6G6Y8U9_9SPHN|nr:hypothetical protein [Sphingosinithalassobacter tenebrarum]QIG81364.1 hypothetical protein G5C33_17285 [Sphingosinithalassobacter tenebrarum]
MNRLEIVLVVVAIGATLYGANLLHSHVYDYYLAQMPEGGLAVATAGWIIATYAPIAVIVIFWRLTKRAGPLYALILHVLLLPCALAALLVGDQLMTSTIRDPDFDATLGAPMMPAMLALMAALGAYGAALMARIAASASEWPPGGREGVSGAVLTKRRPCAGRGPCLHRAAHR